MEWYYILLIVIVIIIAIVIAGFLYKSNSRKHENDSLPNSRKTWKWSTI
jgi:uncharacterized protein YxeA